MSIPLSCAANLASAALFLLRNAAPDEALAIRIRAKRAFYGNKNTISLKPHE
jgi:hypothetical protein